jgi:GTPase SAR1 family protein
LVFDLTRAETHEHLKGWINETKKYTANPHIVVVGSKSDLESRRKVSQEAGEGYASEIRAPYVEASAKEGKNVEKLFSTMATDLMNDSDIKRRQKQS